MSTSMSLATARSLLFAPGNEERKLQKALAASHKRVLEAAARYLQVDRSAVLSWSLPRNGSVGSPPHTRPTAPPGQAGAPGPPR